ncbi:MAG: HTH domain-containing protein [Haloferacaceae archaeon]
MEPDTDLTVDLYVRADAPCPERRTTVIERLKRLERTNRIAGFTVHPWPRAVSLDLAAELDDDDGILGVFRSLETGADRKGHRIRPPFDVRTSRSTITGETDERLVLPVLCLAVYGDRDLLGVYPCTAGESVLTVGDALDALATGDETVLGPPPEDAAPHGDAAPPGDAGAAGRHAERDEHEREHERAARAPGVDRGRGNTGLNG